MRYKYRAVIHNVLNSPVHERALATCPADVLPRKGRWPAGMSDCEGNSASCCNAYLTGGGKACFGLAHGFELSKKDDKRRAFYSEFTYTLFLASCSKAMQTAAPTPARQRKTARASTRSRARLLRVHTNTAPTKQLVIATPIGGPACLVGFTTFRMRANIAQRPKPMRIKRKLGRSAMTRRWCAFSNLLRKSDSRRCAAF